METVHEGPCASDSNVAVHGTQPVGQLTEAMKNLQASDNNVAKENCVEGKIEPLKAEEGVRCMCEDPTDDLGMIQCDVCKQWEHVVCAGFYSNSDKRLQDVTGPRNCLTCQHRAASKNIKLMGFLRDLCRMRRTLSIIYGEGFKSKRELARRLGISTLQFSKYFNGCHFSQTFFGRLAGTFTASFARIYARLEQEGFAKTLSGGPSAKYKVIKTLAIKSRIKSYFTLV